MQASKPTAAIAQHDWDTWLDTMPQSYRQAAYRGRALARRELLRQAEGDQERRIHHDRIGHYEARAEAGE